MLRTPRTLTAMALALALGACVAGPPPEIATPTPELPQVFLSRRMAKPAPRLNRLCRIRIRLS